MSFLIKILFLFLLFVSSLNANFNPSFILKSELAKNNNKFELFDKYDFKNEKFQNYKIRLFMIKEKITKKYPFMRIYCDIDNLRQTNVSYKADLDSIIVRLNKDISDIVELEFSSDTKKPLSFYVKRLSKFDYDLALSSQKAFYGIAYGIIFAAFLYNFVIFLNTFNKGFLYYAILQLMILITLPNSLNHNTELFVSPNQHMFQFLYSSLAIIFTILFSKEILSTKEKLPKINKILNFLLLINIVDFILIIILKESPFYDEVPYHILVILIACAFVALLKGQKTAILYILGWFCIFVSFYLADHDIFAVNDFVIFHIGLPLESIILSFALGLKFKETIKERDEKERLLIHQSKLASMGEMINNIAHQWRQPLNYLSFVNMDIQLANEEGYIKKDFLAKRIKESTIQLEFMSKTIDDFRDFYKPKRQKENFFISSAINKAITIIKPSLDSSKIKLDFKIIQDKEIESYENEYAQIVLNFLSNARDIILQRDIKDALISISLEEIDNKSVLKVEDNAGGISTDIFDKIFDPYFTTKNKGTGIGLYMSKTIAQKHLKADINVKNTSFGASFTLEI